MTTVAMENLWTYIQGLNLSRRNKTWLQERLQESKEAQEKRKDPTLFTKEEFFANIEEAEAQYNRGEYTTQLPGESVADMLRRCGYAV